MGLIRKLRNRLFQNLEFCIHDATLGADLARSGCRMDMVDGALETVDYTLSKCGMVYGTTIKKVYGHLCPPLVRMTIRNTLYPK